LRQRENVSDQNILFRAAVGNDTKKFNDDLRHRKNSSDQNILIGAAVGNDARKFNDDLRQRKNSSDQNILIGAAVGNDAKKFNDDLRQQKNVSDQNVLFRAAVGNDAKKFNDELRHRRNSSHVTIDPKDSLMCNTGRSFAIHRAKGDGNCLFHAVCFLLNKAGWIECSLTGPTLREMCYNFIINAGPSLAVGDFTLWQLCEIDSKTVTAYAESLLQGRYGGEIEVWVISMMLGVNTETFMLKNAGLTRIASTTAANSTLTVHLLYSSALGLSDAGHYDALELIHNNDGPSNSILLESLRRSDELSRHAALAELANIKYRERCQSFCSKDTISFKAQVHQQSNNVPSTKPAVADDDSSTKTDVTDDDSSTKTAVADDNSSTKTAVADDDSSTKTAVADDDSSTKTAVADDESSTKTAVADDGSSTKNAVVADDSSTKTAVADDDSSSKTAVAADDSSTKTAVADDDSSTKTAVADDDSSTKTAVVADDSSTKTAIADDDSSTKTAVNADDDSRTKTAVADDDSSTKTAVVSDDSSTKTAVVADVSSTKTAVVGDDFSAKTAVAADNSCTKTAVVANLGKLTFYKLRSLSLLLDDRNADFCFLSEGAGRRGWHRRVFNGFRLICCEVPPENKLKGGASLLCRQSVEIDSIHFFSGDDWYLTLIYTSSFLLIPIYINPDRDRDPQTAKCALSCLSECCEKVKNIRIIIAGDFNAPTGSKRRDVINSELSCLGFVLINPGVATSLRSNFDIDLIWERTPIFSPDLMCSFSPPALDNVNGLKIDHAVLFFEINMTNSTLDKAINKLPIVDMRYLPDAIRAFLENTGDVMHDVRRAQLTITTGFKNPNTKLPLALKKQLRTPGVNAAKISRDFDLENWRRTLLKFTDLMFVPPKLWALFNKASPNWKTKAERAETIDFFKNIYCTHAAVVPLPSINLSLAPCGPLDYPFTADELRTVMQSVKKNKAPGPNQVRALLIAALLSNDAAAQKIVSLFNGVLSGTVKIPDDWKTARLAVIPKSTEKDAAALDNLRPLSMLCVVRKLFELASLRRISDFLGEDMFDKAQCGFRRKRGTIDGLIAIRNSFDEAFRTHKVLHICSYDIKKYFDSIPFDVLRFHLHKKMNDAGPMLANALASIALVPRRVQFESHDFFAEKGAPQGSPSSPCLANWVLDGAIKKLDSVGITSLTNKQVVYADDLMSISDSSIIHHEKRAIYVAWAEANGLQIALEKSFELEFNPHSVGSLHDNPKGSSSKHLGVIISESGLSLKYPPDEFVNAITSYWRFLSGDAVSVGLVIRHFVGKHLPRILYGYPAVLAEPSDYIRSFYKAVRKLMGLGDEVHIVELAFLMGADLCPVKFMLKQVMNEAKKGSYDESSPSTLMKVNNWLNIAGADLSNVKNIEIGKAISTYESWFVSCCLDLAKAQLSPDIFNDDPWWSYLHDGKEFLHLKGSKVAVRFLLSQFVGVDRVPADCLFCNEPQADTGLHLCLKCPNVASIVPRPFSTEDSSSRLKMRFVKTTLPEAKAVIQWMESVFKIRSERFNILRANKDNLPHRADIASSNYFLSPFRTVVVKKARRFEKSPPGGSNLGHSDKPAQTRALIELLREHHILPFPFSTPPHLWSVIEMSALKTSLENGFIDPEVISLAMKSRSACAVAQKCRYGIYRSLIDHWKLLKIVDTDNSSKDKSSPPCADLSFCPAIPALSADNFSSLVRRKGSAPTKSHWSEDETSRITSAIKSNPLTSAAALQPSIGSKTRKQIADKLSYLRRTIPEIFSIPADDTHPSSSFSPAAADSKDSVEKPTEKSGVCNDARYALRSLRRQSGSRLDL
jgi:hypothetical protein